MDIKKMPLWVSLGISNFKTRKGPIYMALACIVFGLGFLPLPLFLNNWNWIDVLEWSGLMFPMRFGTIFAYGGWTKTILGK